MKLNNYAVMALCIWCGLPGLSSSYGEEAFVDHGVTDPNGYWGRKAEGWFFYKDPPSETVTSEGKMQEWNIAPESIPFSTAWLRVNLPKYLDLAIDNPSFENVKAYFYLQRLALDRASAFALMANEVILGNALIDENSRRPVATLGGTVLDQRAKKGEEWLLKRLSQRVSLIYLYDPADASCQQFSQLIHALSSEFGIYLKTARTSDGSDPSGLFSDAPVAAHLTDTLQVQALPAVFIFSESTGVVPLVQGITARSELISRLLTLSLREELITAQEYAQILPFNANVSLADGRTLLKPHATIGTDALVQPRDVILLFESKNENSSNDVATPEHH